jgi:hypothetical protein
VQVQQALMQRVQVQQALMQRVQVQPQQVSSSFSAIIQSVSG